MYTPAVNLVMEKYRLASEHKAEGEEELHRRHAASQEQYGFPEVRITQHGKPRNYISYAMGLFVSSCTMAACWASNPVGLCNHLISFAAQADGSPTIVLRAMGRAINKAVTIAEILKRKMPLHQWNVLTSIEMVDVYEPIEEGLDVVTSRRYVSCMAITLSSTLVTTASHLDTNHSGYQPPLAASEIQQQRDYHEQSRGMISTS